MNIEPGLIVVIGATLIFYLRLILLQRERVKRLRRQAEEQAKQAGSGSRKKRQQPVMNATTWSSIVSPKRLDWVIAGLGAAAILAGVLVNRGVLFPAAQTFWWLPTAAGIVAFSWAFKFS